MNKLFRHIALWTLLVATFSALAQNEPKDSVYFYNSWEQILYLEPEAMVVDPYIEMTTPYEIHIDAADRKLNKMIDNDNIAVSFGDSIWLINSGYLKREFKCRTMNLHGFMPLFFNEKTAFFTYTGKLGMKEILFGVDEEMPNYSFDYYYIDFANGQVNKVTHQYLSELLEDYHDLQMRYEGMKDYKKFYIIEDYFFKYIDRFTQDDLQPFILDIVGGSAETSIN